MNKESRANLGRKAGITGICCNTLLFAAKLLAGTLAGSVAITADAFNNLSDAAGSCVTFLGFRLAEKPADPQHPYGHARTEYLAGLAAAVFILLIGWELLKTSVTRILHPQPMEFTWVTAAVLIFSIAVKAAMAVYFRRTGNQIHSATLIAASADSRNDVIATSAVLAAGILQALTHRNLDGIMGLPVSLFILWSGIGIGRDTVDPLLGKAPDPNLETAIAAELRAHSQVLGYHDLLLHDYGPGKCFGSVHVEMDMHWDPLAAHDLIDHMERMCLERYGVQLCIHYDPIVTDDPELNLLRQAVLDCVHQLDSRISAHDFRMVGSGTCRHLLFDLAIPFDRQGDEAAIRQEVEAALNRVKPDCQSQITIDDMAFSNPPQEQE